MKSLNTYIFVSFVLISFGCQHKSVKNNSTIDSASNSDTSMANVKMKGPTPATFGAMDDTTTPPLESFKKQLLAQEDIRPGNEFYTEKNYQGEKIVQHGGGGWANYDLEDGIVIKSMKLLPGFQVSFDFGSDCNSVESGHFHYYNNSSTDILMNFGCDENFSKVKEIYVRWLPETLGNAVQVWEKPYLLGKGNHLMGPKNSGEVKLYRWKDFGFPTATSIQIGKGMLVNLYKDEYFQSLLIQINTSVAALDKPYVLTSYFTHAAFKSLSIVRL